MPASTLTLADVAAGSPAAVTLLERLGIDYCCGGRLPFDEACAAKGLSPAEVMQDILAAQRSAPAPRDWRSAPLTELVQHILDTHHAFLQRELPAISNRIDKVLAVHGQRDPEMLPRLAAVFQALFEELDMHMHKEEQILFPVIVQYSHAAAAGRALPRSPFGSIANPIAMMEREHSNAGDALLELNSLTSGFQLPPYACATVSALYDGIQALAADLHLHIHLENNILFPRAIAMEQE